MSLVRSRPSRKESNKMGFIGRTQELSKLKQLMSSDDMSMALIYGRRRVGKSGLVKQAMKESDIPAVTMSVNRLRRKLTLKEYARLFPKFWIFPSLALQLSRMLRSIFLNRRKIRR